MSQNVFWFVRQSGQFQWDHVHEAHALILREKGFEVKRIDMSEIRATVTNATVEKLTQAMTLVGAQQFDAPASEKNINFNISSLCEAVETLHANRQKEQSEMKAVTVCERDYLVPHAVASEIRGIRDLVLLYDRQLRVARGERDSYAEQIRASNERITMLGNNIAILREEKNHAQGKVESLAAENIRLNEARDEALKTVEQLRAQIDAMIKAGTLLETRLDRQVGELKVSETTVIRPQTAGEKLGVWNPSHGAPQCRCVGVSPNLRCVSTALGFADKGVIDELRAQTTAAHEARENLGELCAELEARNKLTLELDQLLNVEGTGRTLAALVAQIREMKPARVSGATEDDLHDCMQVISTQPSLTRAALEELLDRHNERVAAAIIRNTVAQPAQTEGSEAEVKKAARRMPIMFFTMNAQSFTGNGHHVNINPAAYREAREFIYWLNGLINDHQVLQSAVKEQLKFVPSEKQAAEVKGREALKFLRGMLHGWPKQSNYLTIYSSARKEIAKIVEGK
ncbi:hypothetical protein CPT_Maja_061 [Burkholderia phage Maja]|uniref:Uncharacterized protein n=1 Tax=Burkholderia phage Maja TaxID=2767571 RepID=A0A7S6R788_9CAUD|nr:hypothetical protein CPT_Maja_061 [Burkholderia phage Maja]